MRGISNKKQMKFPLMEIYSLLTFRIKYKIEWWLKMEVSLLFLRTEGLYGYFLSSKKQSKDFFRKYYTETAYNFKLLLYLQGIK